MDEENRKLKNQKIPGTYEYQKRKDLRNDYGEELNHWGKKSYTTKQEAHEYMLGRMEGVKTYRIPRELGMRIDIGAPAKIIYGFLVGLPGSVCRLYIREIAGMCGLDASAVQTGLYDLEHHGYIKKWHTYVAQNRRGPLLIKKLPLPDRNIPSLVPSIMKTNITNIEERIRERFYDA